MKRVFQRVKTTIQKLSPYHLHISIGILILAIISTFVIASKKSDSTVQVSAEKTAEQNMQKKYFDEHFESVPAKHSRKHSKGVEDPRYSLGHCNPQEAPREIDMKSSNSKPMEDWSPC